MGMMAEGSRAGVVCVRLRFFDGPQDDNLVLPTTGGDDDEEKMGGLKGIREFAVQLFCLI